MKDKKLIIFGAGILGHLAFEYFSKDSDYTIECFTVQSNFLKEKTFCGIPVVPFEDIEKNYSPSKYDMYVALGWYRLNYNRLEFYKKAKEKGYKLASYISSRAFIWSDVTVGDNCFIMEDCVLQPKVKIGNNVTLWSACCVEHFSEIQDNVTLVSRVAVAGNTQIKENCFVGVNASIGDNLIIEKDNFIAMGSVIRKSTIENSIYEGNPAKRNRFITAKQFLKV